MGSRAEIIYHSGVGTFVVENFGCRATQADGAAIERQLRERGLQRAWSSQQAELVVLNTCTVTAAADRDARAAIRRIHRENPHCQIVVTGCYAQRAPQEIAALRGVSQVIGNSHKHLLAEIALGESQAFSTISAGIISEGTVSEGGFVPLAELNRASRPRPQSPEILVSDIFAHTELRAAPVFEGLGLEGERTRPNLKIQDGCDNRCSFCVIPSVRGQSRSLPLAPVVHEINLLVQAGYREVVISGINLGRWGRDFEERRRFEDVVRAILSQTSLEKLRISSIEPMDWSDALIAMIAQSPRIARHAHVPMQSGSDAVLRRMHRKYRPWHYREKIEKIRAAVPTAAIGADVMVGFPGESDAEFEETRRLVEELPLTYLHVFTYSPRPGTPAAGMCGQVPVSIARDRNRVLRELSAKKKLAFARGFIGKALPAITLNTVQAGEEAEFTEALTDNYLQLRVKGHHEPNRWLTVQIQAMENGLLRGTRES